MSINYAQDKGLNENSVKIEKIKITRKLSIVSNAECYKSKAFEFFYTELSRLKRSIEN